MADSFSEIRHVRAMLNKHINSKHQFDESENVISILKFLEKMEQKLNNIEQAIQDINITERQVIVQGSSGDVGMMDSIPLFNIDIDDKEFIPEVEVSDKSKSRVKDVESRKTDLKTDVSIFDQILGDKQ